MIRQVIFDCFGTLIDTGTGSVDAVREILRNIRYDADPTDFYASWKKKKKEHMLHAEFHSEKEWFILTLGELFAEHGIDRDASLEAAPMIRSLFACRLLYPDVRPALQMLAEKGILFAIGSTTDNDSILYYLRQNGLESKYLFTSEDLRCYKPDPRFYAGILDAAGWKAGECLFVGDGLEEDVLGPKKAGMKAVLLDRKGIYRGEGKENGPDAVIRSLSELGEILEQRL